MHYIVYMSVKFIRVIWNTTIRHKYSESGEICSAMDSCQVFNEEKKDSMEWSLLIRFNRFAPCEELLAILEAADLSGGGLFEFFFRYFDAGDFPVIGLTFVYSGDDIDGNSLQTVIVVLPSFGAFRR